ncbi:MAG: CBS domain-containing protein [Gemmatimonadetes bacterium]|nr:CBS domain-containing protein [Gemmatimonadota bacterium]
MELDRRLAVTPVANAVIADTPTVAPEARAWVAADLMARHQVTTLPVVENRRVTGMITASDLAAILTHYEEPGRV